MELEDHLIINANFLHSSLSSYQPVSFYISKNYLITMHAKGLSSFDEFYKRSPAISAGKLDPLDIVVRLFELRIDLDADYTEDLTKAINLMSKKLTYKKQIKEDYLIGISELKEKAILLRENIIDKQRVLSALYKSSFVNKQYLHKINIFLEDIASLLDHTSFIFSRLDYLQNTYLGLINTQQNKIIKIFTIVTVIFLPPTLVASLYGMNFKFMPELDWKYGYPFAILLMILFSSTVLLYFKKRGWL
jgi:magnesium transporter